MFYFLSLHILVEKHFDSNSIPRSEILKKTCLLKARNFWLYILFEKRRIKKKSHWNLKSNQYPCQSRGHIVSFLSFFLFFWQKNTFIKNVRCQMKQSCYQMMHAQEREALASCIFLTKRRARRGNFIRASITINLSHNQVYVTLHCLCFLPARRKKKYNFDTSCANTAICNKVSLDMTRLITSKSGVPYFAIL